MIFKNRRKEMEFTRLSTGYSSQSGFFFQLYPLHVNSLHTNFSAHWFVISFSKGKTPAILFLNHFKSLKGQHQQLVARAGVNP